ncbi:MAG: M20 family metallopeptidase [Nitrospirae bacterium]|nr:M20 family metallopeptidase [Nitrospirota bacterium]
MPDNVKKGIIKKIDELSPLLITIAKEIHKRPELAFEEDFASQLLSSTLEKHGFKIERGIGGLRTAFCATSIKGNNKPAIGFLAEYDALPEIGHGCGHNLIGPSSIGAAIALSESAIKGRIVIIGAPAEERGGGKVILAKTGIFDDLDAAMMVHPSNDTEVVKRLLAAIDVAVEYTGRPAHAAASPWKGINALDAMVLAYNNISALRQQLKPDVRIHGIITNGGAAPNIIPAYTSARFLVRALEMKDALKALKKVKGCFTAASKATGAKIRITVGESAYDAFRPNYPLAEAFKKNLLSLGIKVKKEDEYKELGSSDIGNVSRIIPTLHPNLDICHKQIPHHTVEFKEMAGSDSGLKGMIIAAKAMAMTAADIILDKDLLKRMKESHRKR